MFFVGVANNGLMLALLTSSAQSVFGEIDKERLAMFSDGAGGTMAGVGLLPFARVAWQVAAQVLPPYRTLVASANSSSPSRSCWRRFA